jgi:hypothetical protein
MRSEPDLFENRTSLVTGLRHSKGSAAMPADGFGLGLDYGGFAMCCTDQK